MTLSGGTVVVKKLNKENPSLNGNEKKKEKEIEKEGRRDE